MKLAALFLVLFGISCGDDRPYGYADWVYAKADGKWHKGTTVRNGDGSICYTEWAKYKLAPPPLGLYKVNSWKMPCGREPDDANPSPPEWGKPGTSGDVGRRKYGGPEGI